MSSRVLPAGGDEVISLIRWANGKPDARKELPNRQSLPSQESTPSSDIDPEVRNALEEAFQRGYSEGIASVRTEAEQAMGRIAENISRTLTSLAEFRPRLREEAEGDLVKLSIAIARRILRREISIDPDSLRALIKVALEKLQAKEGCRARVHTELYRPVKDCLDRLAPSPPIEVTADGSLEAGGIIFETGHGDLDASIESQLREIERGFADRLGR